MIAAAIDKILSISQPLTVKIDGSTYTTEKLHRVDEDMRADPIQVKTLTGLLDYINAHNDGGWEGYFLHVVSETRVDLISQLDSDRKRETLVVANAETPRTPIGSWFESEQFLIAAQATIVQDENTDIAAILKFAGTVEDGTITEYKDDGVTQKATVKVGVKSRAEGLVPSPCVLKPYRTFLEVDQPESKFVFRMKNGRDGIECALYSADGGAWKREAMQSIKEYLLDELEKAGVSMYVIA